MFNSIARQLPTAADQRFANICFESLDFSHFKKAARIRNSMIRPVFSRARKLRHQMDNIKNGEPHRTYESIKHRVTITNGRAVN
jgi:hypothetical protein